MPSLQMRWRSGESVGSCRAHWRKGRPSTNDSTSTSREMYGARGSGNVTNGRERSSPTARLAAPPAEGRSTPKLERKVSRLLASTVRSSCTVSEAANSASMAVGLSQRSDESISISPKAASSLMSVATCSPTRGCSTLTATGRHSSSHGAKAAATRGRTRRRPRYTCAMQPEPIGVRSSSSSCRHSGPNMESRARSVCDHVWAGVLSCKWRNRRQPRSPNMSGREEPHCASLISSAPEFSKARTHQRHQSSSVHCAAAPAFSGSAQQEHGAQQQQRGAHAAQYGRALGKGRHTAARPRASEKGRHGGERTFHRDSGYIISNGPKTNMR